VADERSTGVFRRALGSRCFLGLAQDDRYRLGRSIGKRSRPKRLAFLFSKPFSEMFFQILFQVFFPGPIALSFETSPSFSVTNF
jgi:hypothetical protein